MHNKKQQGQKGSSFEEYLEVQSSNTLRPEKQQILQSLIYLQCRTNEQLITNAYLTTKFLYRSQQLETKNNISENSTNPSKKDITLNFQILKNIKMQSSHYSIKQRRRNKLRQKSQSQYQPSREQEKTENNLFETKNIPKNYSKMLIRFIRVHRQYIAKVLKIQKIQENSFFNYIDLKNNQIKTIAELRSLWIQSEINQFSKALRIISMQCFRKFSLSYIYNSRIEKQKRNVKYRIKLIRALQKPQQFTQMKDF